MSIWTSLLKTGKSLGSMPAAELGYEFPPLHHDAKMCSVICSLDKDGNFLQFEKRKAPEKAIIPVTLYSMKRAGLDASDFPNPLNDKAEYIGSENYVQLLSDWADYAIQHRNHGSDLLAAVLAFVRQGTFLDLASESGVNRSSFVCFKVNQVESWKSDDLFRSWIDFYCREVENDQNIRKGLCMITGENDALVLKAPKAIIQQHPNGKLISCNDRKGFTYRGVMNEADEVMSIGVKASHFVHQGLKYIFSHGAVEIGNNDWLCVWSPEHPTVTYASEFLYGNSDTANRPEITKDDWNKSIYGSKILSLDPNETIVTAVIGGATDGRLSVKHFEESTCSQFVDRINRWHAALSWEIWDRERRERIPYYPCAFAIVSAAYGHPDEDGKTIIDESLRAMWINRLLNAVTKDLPIPQPIVDALINRAHNAAIYPDWTLLIALAALRKQYYDKTGVILATTNQKEFRNDRSYLYGRLLAIYDKAEQDYLDLQQDSRTTQAKQLQPGFVKNPAKYERLLAGRFKTVWSKKLYKKQLNRYRTAIAAIKAEIAEVSDDPLETTYLFGYYSERRNQYTKQNEGGKTP